MIQIVVIRSNLEIGPCLLGDTNSSIPAASFLVTPALSSLVLIVPRNPYLRVTKNIYGRKQIRTIFEISGTYFDLVVTDFLWEKKLSEYPEGDYSLTAAGLKQRDRVLFTISLGEPFNGYCYKLVTAIIVLPESWRDFF